MTKVRRYAEGTTVAVEKSRMQIEKLLSDHGADAVMIGRGAQGAPWVPGEIGAALEAGTNCGSCRPELASILAAAQAKVAAE